MIFRQFRDPDSSSYTYLIGDPTSREAMMIDPVAGHVDQYLKLLSDLGLRLRYSIETHVHADRVTGSGRLRQRTGAETGVSRLCGAIHADHQLAEGDVLRFGEAVEVKVIATPGHTRGSVSFLWCDRVFTGDALLINGCGRTDLQGGDAGTLYDSITTRLFTLPGETLVYPGHDYHGRWVSCIAQERSINPRLAGHDREQFIALMGELKLPKPKNIEEAIAMNRLCGLTEEDLRQG